MTTGEFLTLAQALRAPAWAALGIEASRWGRRPREAKGFPETCTMWACTAESPREQALLLPLGEIAFGFPAREWKKYTSGEAFAEDGSAPWGVKVQPTWPMLFGRLLTGGYIRSCPESLYLASGGKQYAELGCR